MSSLAAQLWNVLNSLGQSSQFCTSGSLEPVLPGLEVEGIGNVGVPVSATDAKRLIKQAAQAPYGRGEETIVDTDVRRVWQLEPGKFELRNAAWGKFVDGIVQSVRKEFGIRKKVQQELYKLLVYEKGSFFAPHRDTEKIPGMFATLVVCLPSQHEGGTLIVSHDGLAQQVEFGGSGAEFNMQYAAFYADCQHEIKPVTSGYRVCLVYNLAIARQKTQPSAPVSSEAVQAAAELLPRFFTDESPKKGTGTICAKHPPGRSGKLYPSPFSRDKIVIPFKHQYSEAALDPRELKGADRSMMAVLARAAEKIGYQAFVALLTHYQTGIPDYGTVSYSYSRSRRRYRRFDGGMDDDISGEDEGAEFEEVFEEYRSLTGWLDPQGRKQPFGKLRFDEEDLVSDAPAESWAFKQQISEATGNEGATMERWYRQAAVVIWPRDRYFRILAGEGQQHAVPALEELVAMTDDPTEDASCLAFATEIVNGWKKGTRWFTEDYLSAVADWPGDDDAASRRASQPTSLSTRMLSLLDQIGTADLAVRFVREILPGACDGGEGPALSRLGGRFGWQRLAQPLKQFFAKQKAADYSSNKLATPITIFEDLCCSPPAMTDKRRSVCKALVDEVNLVIERWDKRRQYEWQEPEPRAGIVESMFRALTALGDIDRLVQFVAYVLERPKRYELRSVLIPAVKTLDAELAPGSPSRNSLDQLLHHCLAELRSATAVPIEPPADWSRSAKVGCSCADCKELVRFLRDPHEQVHRFPRRKELRRHLHVQINSNQLDVTHVTERKGSPHTLVCTKTQASHQRQLAQFHEDVTLLEELAPLAGSADPRSNPPSSRRRTKTNKATSKKGASKTAASKKTPVKKRASKSK